MKKIFGIHTGILLLCGVLVLSLSACSGGSWVHRYTKVTDDGGVTALMHNIKSGYTNLVGPLLERNHDVNERDEKGATALIYAVKFDSSAEVINLLLKYGANVNAKDNSEETALTYAIIYGRTDIAAILRKHKVQKNN